MADIFFLLVGAITSFVIAYILFSEKTKKLVKSRQDITESEKNKKIKGAFIAGVICSISGCMCLCIIFVILFS